MWSLRDDKEIAAECFRHLRADKGDGRHGYPRQEANLIVEQVGFVPFAPSAWEAEQKRLQALTMTN